jgi:adenosylcobinamide-phosphate synthase
MLLIYVAFIIDFFIGDPKWFPHPIRGVGWMITLFEKITVKLFGRNRFAGIVTGGLVIGITVVVVWATIFFSKFAITDPALKMQNIYPFLDAYLPKNSNIISCLVTLFWLWAGISARCLANAGTEIYRGLKNKPICATRVERQDCKARQLRKSLSMIVGRDTEDLDETGICRATIETVSENTVDGILSPLFFAAIGGAPLLWAFKAVSTCDSMIGYKNEKYIRFGTFCAQLDDLLNYIPARLSYILYPIAAFILKLSPGKSYQVAVRDAEYHASPNSGISEAAAAGALEVSLGGPATYDGVTKEKKFFGAEFPPPEKKHIKTSINLMWVVSILMLLLLSLTIYLLPIILKYLADNQRSGG